MGLRQLRIFTEVYQEKSITKAADKLHIVQPSVSLTIKELEEEYGIKLFDRIGRGIFVTETGEAFYEYASHIISLYDEMENKMKSPSAPFQINMGSSITIGCFIVPHIVARFRDIYKNGEINVRIQNSKQIVQGVMKNEIDIGVVEDRVEDDKLISIPFLKDQLLFVCNNSNQLTKKNKIELEDIARQPLFMREPGSASREIADGLFKANQIKINIAWESISNQSIIHALKENEGITVISHKLVEKEIAEGSLYVLPLYPEEFKREFILIYHRNKYLTPAIKSLIGLICEEKKESRHIKTDFLNL